MRLGTKSNPFIIRVQSQERAAEVSAFCDSRNWYAIFEINDEDEEDLEDLDIKLNTLPVTFEQPKVGRNDVCICGSGKKFKKCCLEKVKIPIAELVQEKGEKICAYSELEEWLNGPDFSQ